MHYLYLAIAIIAEVTATSSLKYTEDFTKWLPSLIVILGYGIAFYFLTLSLKVLPIGIAYAIWAGAGIALITLIGWFWFGEKLNLAALIGIGLIITGVVVIQLFSKTNT